MVSRFNAEMADECENSRGFLTAHYQVTERDDSDFWHYVKSMGIPQSLAERLYLFKIRGEALVCQRESFKESNWFSVLVGQGLFPEAYHLVADAVTSEELKLPMVRVRDGIRRRVDGVPSHCRYLAKLCSIFTSTISTGPFLCNNHPKNPHKRQPGAGMC